MSRKAGPERARALVDVGAIERNCSTLKQGLAGEAELCVVVKADAYGHGAAPCAGAALRGGASRLAVATAREAEELRLHFPEAPILVMGALTESELRVALAADADIAVWRQGFRELVSRLAGELGTGVRVHVKHDSGMGRLGEPDPETVLELAGACDADSRLELAGLWTHFATADERGDAFFGEQLEAFGAVAERVRQLDSSVLVHAANSAATLREPSSHFDMVRCGVAIYGLDPFGEDPSEHGLEPALELRSYVADLKRFDAGMSAGYGRTWIAKGPTWVGVLPIGYGDGYRRGLSNQAEVLVGGRRYPVVGTVSMDNITIDLGRDPAAAQGAEAVLIGSDGSDRVLAEELARPLGTINYEVTCGISSRVPRVHAG